MCSQRPTCALGHKEPGLAGQHDGEPRTWKHLSSQLEGPLPGEPLARRTTSERIPCSPSAFAMGTWPQTLPYSFLAFPPPRRKFCPRSSSFSTLLLFPPSSSSPSPRPPSSSPYILPSIPASLLYATLADACHLPPSRASATTGCVWYLAPGSGPLPGAPRLYSTPRRVGRTYGSLMGVLATCVKWSLWHILAWVSGGPWQVADSPTKPYWVLCDSGSHTPQP